LTPPTGGDKTTAILCHLTMLLTYRWLKGRCCDNVAATILFPVQMKSQGMNRPTAEMSNLQDI
jgi:hypothetical protein